MASAAADDLRRSIEDFIRDQFAAARISAVEVCEEIEQEQDSSSVLYITVLCDSTPYELAHREPPGFLTMLRKHLVAAGKFAYPVVSFQPVTLKAA